MDARSKPRARSQISGSSDKPRADGSRDPTGLKCISWSNSQLLLAASEAAVRQQSVADAFPRLDGRETACQLHGSSSAAIARRRDLLSSMWSCFDNLLRNVPPIQYDRFHVQGRRTMHRMMRMRRCRTNNMKGSSRSGVCWTQSRVCQRSRCGVLYQNATDCGVSYSVAHEDETSLKALKQSVCVHDIRPKEKLLSVTSWRTC